MRRYRSTENSKQVEPKGLILRHIMIKTDKVKRQKKSKDGKRKTEHHIQGNLPKAIN